MVTKTRASGVACLHSIHRTCMVSVYHHNDWMLSCRRTIVI